MEKSQWQITSEPVLDFEQIQPIEGIKMKIEEVMKRIQEFLQNENPPAQWFYPDNLTILSKIQETFISFHAQYSTNQLINITVCMNHGTNEQFSSLLDKLLVALETTNENTEIPTEESEEIPII